MIGVANNIFLKLYFIYIQLIYFFNNYIFLLSPKWSSFKSAIRRNVQYLACVCIYIYVYVYDNVIFLRYM